MKTFSLTRMLFSGICFLMVMFIFQGLICHAASLPLPQKIDGPALHRTDCLVGEKDRDDLFVAYIQEFIFEDTRAGISLYSCINWREGFLKSEGIGKEHSTRAAELVARSNALKTLLVINLDSTATLQQYFTHQAQVRLKIQNVLIKNAAIQDIPADPKKPDQAKVMVTIPFYGISGLTSFFLDDQEIYLPPLTRDTQPSPTAKQPEPGDYTGIIIDARDLPDLEPGLFPKIVSEQGETLYEASQVDKEILQSHGMIEYVSEAAGNTARRIGANPFIVKPVFLASTVDLPRISLNSMQLKRSEDRLLVQAQTRERRRKGNNLTVTSTESTGQIPVNVVVSVEDAKKIKQLNENHQLDSQGKYTILIGGEIGGVKGQYLNGLFAMSHQ